MKTKKAAKLKAPTKPAVVLKTQPPTRTSDAAAASAAAFFAALPDDAFFSNGPSSPVQHVYLYGAISDDTLRKLRREVDVACKGSVDGQGGTTMAVAPRPIVLHINSPGGSAYAGLSMMSIFNESRVPICACVDGLSASAATFVSILAPYRVMSPMATCLVHDYASFVFGKREDLLFDVVTVGEALTTTLRDMYLRRTRIGREALAELMSRDLLLDAQRCLSLGVCDRVLTAGGCSSSSSSSSKPAPAPALLPMHVVLRKTNLNHVRFDCAAADDFALGAAQNLDRMLGAGDGLKPVVLHADGLACLRSVVDHVASLAQRVAALGRRTETYGIIDTTIDLVNALPLLMCRHRVMYAHASIVVHMVYDAEPGWMLRDVVANTQLMLDTVRRVLHGRTRLPAELVGAIDRRRFLLSAADCLRHGVVDEIV